MYCLAFYSPKQTVTFNKHFEGTHRECILKIIATFIVQIQLLCWTFFICYASEFTVSVTVTRCLSGICWCSSAVYRCHPDLLPVSGGLASW